MAGRFRAPGDAHSLLIVSAASVATVFYTMWPWIQEQKQRRLEQEHLQFQLLKQTDPAAAQRHIDYLASKEWWIQKKFRQIAEERQVMEKLNSDYVTTRAITMSPAAQQYQQPLPSDLFDPLPEGTQLHHFPSTKEINAALMVGKTLTNNAEIVANIQQTQNNPLDGSAISGNTANVVKKEQDNINNNNAATQKSVNKGKAIMADATDTSGRMTLTTHFDFDSLSAKEDPGSKV